MNHVVVMGKPIAWGITGGGHFLIETFEVMSKVSNRASVTSFVSRAGEEVIRIYGLTDELEKISPGAHYSEVIRGTKDGYSSIHSGRLARGVYSKLVIAPATANTIAKIAHGIADTLVTNAAAQAFKAKLPVLILPTDHPSVKSTRLPVRVDSDLCQACKKCPPEDICRVNAFYRRNGEGRINYLVCTGCKDCIEACSYNAVLYGEEIRVNIRSIDVANLKKVGKMYNICILKNHKELEELLV